jgi:ferredoxin, 2Fe-2S
MSIKQVEIAVCYTVAVPHKVTLLPQGITIDYDPATMPNSEHGLQGSLLDICLNHGVHLEHACGGSCACTTCHIIVKQGDSNLSEAEEDEMDRVDQAAGVTLHSRLGCQAVVRGDVTVEIPNWNRNYVSEGGGSMNLGDAIPLPKK